MRKYPLEELIVLFVTFSKRRAIKKNYQFSHFDDVQKQVSTE